ncbi:MAG: hypothetical protein H0W74_08480 [Sphingosinicella sp.]|nr:hypothetical protein [Sphingosinicella sp.]
MRIAALLLIAAALVSACREKPDYLTNMTRDQIIEMARKEPLQERYNIYKEVYNSDVPPETYLIPLVVEETDRAYALALQEASTGSYLDILAAIEVILHINQQRKSKCRDEDLRRILTNLGNVSKDSKLNVIVGGEIRFACRVGT